MQHNFIQESDYCYRDKKFYVKFSGQGIYGHGDTVGEYESYRKIADFFITPRVKLLNHRTEPVLVMNSFAGKSLSSQIENNPEGIRLPLRRFTHDLLNSWEKSQLPLVEDKLSRNARVENLKSLDGLEVDNEIF